MKKRGAPAGVNVYGFGFPGTAVHWILVPLKFVVS
jgi:hypothetical protein